jgi:hypothetical protein
VSTAGTIGEYPRYWWDPPPMPYAPGWQQPASMATSITSVTALPVTLSFFTWRDALLVALAAASRFTVRGRPSVRRDADRWVVTYRETPIARNS